MRYRRGLVKQLLIAIIFVTAVAIPVYFISDAYLEREDLALLARLDQTSTDTITPTPTQTPIFPPTWTPKPSSTPSETPTPSATPTEILIPMTGFDFTGAYIKNVVHIPEGGGDTMVTIVVQGILEGEFFAQVEIPPDFWLYVCVIREWSEDHLFCFGDRLPDANDATIHVFEVLEEDEETILVFEAEIVVPKFVPTKTNTPSAPKQTSTFTPTPTNTITPSPMVTPSLTPTLPPPPPP